MTTVRAAASAHRGTDHAPPAIQALSLGAGAQASTCLLLACHGRIPRYDVAIFADTGWEPQAVYRHLHRLERIAARWQNDSPTHPHPPDLPPSSCAPTPRSSH